MARYIVLEFSDNKEADDFVESFQQGSVFFARPHPTLEGHFSQVRPHEPANIVGYYMRPTLACDCPHESKKSQFGYSRGTWPCDTRKMADGTYVDED